MKEFLIKIFGVMAVTVIGKGLLIWLSVQFQIYPELWVASLLGIAQERITSYPAISWMIAGIFGLSGLFIGPWLYKMGLKLFKDNKSEIPTKRLNEWQANEELVETLRSLTNEHTNVKIIYFDNINFLFAERLFAAFELAGWRVNFNKTAQGNHNPHYYGGVEVKGDNRILVESICKALAETGCSGVKEIVGATEIKQGHPKYNIAQNKVYITIGYEE